MRRKIKRRRLFCTNNINSKIYSRQKLYFWYFSALFLLFSLFLFFLFFPFFSFFSPVFSQILRDLKSNDENEIVTFYFGEFDTTSSEYILPDAVFLSAKNKSYGHFTVADFGSILVIFSENVDFCCFLG